MSSDDSLLVDYINTFYGYGNYRGAWWLVGMEEGGGDSANDIQTRLRLWDARGRKELESVDIFHSSPEHAKWFTPRPPLQATWRGLIRLILSAEGRPTDTETVRAYQGAELGRVGSNNCILELLPLPSPTVGHWIYGGHSSLPQLRTRQTYTDHVTPSRVQHLRGRIIEHKPKAVIFYSRNYRMWWEQIAETGFRPTELEGLEVTKGLQTVFAMTRHPVYRGVTSEYFVRAGAAIAALALGP